MKCHGYREVPQTMFHHETAAIISKNRSTDTKAAALPSCHVSMTKEQANSGALIAGTPLERRPLHTSMDDFAVCYFRAFHFILPGLETSRNHDILVACMKAHGLATCAVTENHSYAKNEARRYYLRAIREVNTALVAGLSATDDDILLAIMILGTIETITDSWQRSLEGWSSHVRGCTALLKERGPQQVRTPQGRLLFMQATACLVSHCLLSSNRMPSIVDDLTEHATKSIATSKTTDLHDHNNDNPSKWSQFIVSDDPTWAMHQALLTLTNVNSDIKLGQVQDAQKAVERLLLEDDHLSTALHRSQQLGTVVDTYTMHTASLTYEEAFNQYLTIQTLNSLRSCRILVHTMTKELLRTTSQDSEPWWQKTLETQIQASTAIVDDLKSEILASVPYQVHLAQKGLFKQDAPDGFPTLRQLLSPPAGVSNAVFVAAEQMLTGHSIIASKFFSADDPPILRISHGYNVIGALLLVGCISEPGSDDRKLACRLLRLVGEAFSVRQAGIFAERLESAGKSKDERVVA